MRHRHVPGAAAEGFREKRHLDQTARRGREVGAGRVVTRDLPEEDGSDPDDAHEIDDVQPDGAGPSTDAVQDVGRERAAEQQPDHHQARDPEQLRNRERHAQEGERDGEAHRPQHPRDRRGQIAEDRAADASGGERRGDASATRPIGQERLQETHDLDLSGSRSAQGTGPIYRTTARPHPAPHAAWPAARIPAPSIL